MNRRFATAVALLVFAGFSSSALALQGDEGPMPSAPAKEAAPAPAPAAPAAKDIVAVATAAGDFTTLIKALGVAGLVETLQGPGPFTVFAPTDEAFAKIPAKELNKLLANKAKLKKVLLYHVVSGKVMAADVVKLKEAKSVEGGELKIKSAKGSVKINNATVTKPDIEASNGVIHVIDTVLMPKK